MVRVMYPVRVILRRAGFVAKIGEDHMWHTISQGVREARIHYGLKEGVVDASGGYDSAAEEHEPRIIPTYFTTARQYAEAETSGGGDGDDDEGVTVETTESDTIAEDAPSTLEVLVAARGLDPGPGGEEGADGQTPGDQEPHKKDGKAHKNGKVHKA
jgi:hypothetical protein